MSYVLSEIRRLISSIFVYKTHTNIHSLSILCVCFATASQEVGFPFRIYKYFATATKKTRNRVGEQITCIYHSQANRLLHRHQNMFWSSFMSGWIFLFLALSLSQHVSKVYLLLQSLVFRIQLKSRKLGHDEKLSAGKSSICLADTWNMRI